VQSSRKGVEGLLVGGMGWSIEGGRMNQITIFQFFILIGFSVFEGAIYKWSPIIMAIFTWFFSLIKINLRHYIKLRIIIHGHSQK
jgi:hypothetical protein